MITPCRTTNASPTACGLYQAGHRTHPIQAKKGSSDRENWVDALATFRGDGVIALHVWASDETVEVWHHARLPESIPDGLPVEFHRPLHLLRVEQLMLCVAAVSP